MAYRICKMFEVENGHMLSKHPDKCRFPHGHTRKVELVLEAETLDRNDMVCDFEVIKETMSEFLAQFDHAMCVNTADPNYHNLKATYGERVIGFEDVDPTTEVTAKTIFDHFRGSLLAYKARNDVRYPLGAIPKIVKVRVWETSSSWAEYLE